MNEKQYWKSKTYTVKSRRGVMFLFPAGFTWLWMYRPLIYIINRMGIEVIGFGISWKSAASDLEFNDIVTMIDEVSNYVKKRIAQEETFYSVFGNSFGGVIAVNVAKRNPEIKSLILNVTHGSSASLFWDYKPTKKMIDKLRAEGINTEEELRKITQPIESSEGIEVLSDRRIVCLVSLSDKITKDNWSTVTSLQRINPTTVVHTTKLGHFSGGVKNALSVKKWKAVL